LLFWGYICAPQKDGQQKSFTGMGMFIISRRPNGEYKFVFTSRKGKTVFTSISCKEKSDCEAMIAAIRENIGQFAFTKQGTASGKYFFRLSKGGLVLATSRKFSTQLMLQKGITEITTYMHRSEVLDFSGDDMVFPPAEEIWGSEAVQVSA
jgi:uncharacterized protein